jgi:hypothetical protein
MQHCHGDNACPDDRRGRDAERGPPRALPQRGPPDAGQTVSCRPATGWPRGVRNRIWLGEPAGPRSGDSCSRVSRRNGSLGRSGRYRFLQRLTVRAAASICAPQPRRSRGRLVLFGPVLRVPRLRRPLASASPGSTGTRGSRDRLMPALHRCRLVRDCARVTTPAGDSSHRSRSAHRRARLTPLVRHESPRGGLRAADAAGAGAGAQATTSDVFGDTG